MANNKLPFHDKHPFLVNSVLIVIALCVAVYVGMLFLDVFTSHGQEKLVPEVRNLPLEQAIDKIESAGLDWEIADSAVYNESFKPGVITEQEPKGGSYIKAVRKIYLTVNASHPRIVSFPRLQDTPITQSLATLHTMGFKNIEIDTVESPYQDIVVKVEVNGHQIAPGSGVMVNARVRITVGDGTSDDNDPYMALDTATIDSIEAVHNAQLMENNNQ